ncbi:MAG: chromosome condensation regulator [Harvfovirus sp.]|uniref:Chromosome condensation regulator n=1 Tax=Harvfovirus sp. TaxID=2487768 RepID=A0A3G5A2V7_9VIRU|nr:MAG: chromosome condensation regulator [Harvfovirus sp.]
MDLISLIVNLPTDLQYLLTNYDPTILFILPVDLLKKYDWFKLIKLNFSLLYDKRTSTNEEIMHTYAHNCTYERPKIICGYRHTFIILTDGTLMSYGHNCYGQLGIGNVPDQNIFTEIKDINKNIAEVVCGYSHTIIRFTDGTLMGCGDNTYGQLGLTDGVNPTVPLLTEIKNIPKNIVKVTCGYYSTFIRLTDGTLMSCGYNTCGHLGLGNSKIRNPYFKVVPGIPKNIIEVSTGHDHTIIRLTNGKLMGCGRNTDGRLGIKNKKIFEIFTEIDNLPRNIAEAVCGLFETVIRLTDGTLMCSSAFCNSDTRFLEMDISPLSKPVAKVLCYGYPIITLTDDRVFHYKFPTFTEISGIPINIAEVISASTHITIRLTDGTLMKAKSTVFDGEYGFTGLTSDSFTKIN